MSDNPKPPVAQTLTLMFDNDPTWGDLLWFAEQVKQAEVDPAETILFEWDRSDDRDPNPPIVGMSLITHPGPAEATD